MLHPNRKNAVDGQISCKLICKPTKSPSQGSHWGINKFINCLQEGREGGVRVQAAAVRPADRVLPGAGAPPRPPGPRGGGARRGGAGADQGLRRPPPRARTRERQEHRRQQ